MKYNFVVIIKESYVRDMQVDEKGNDEDWRDWSGPVLVGVFRVKDKEEAIEKAAKESGLSKDVLYVLEV